jgi:amidase
MALGARPLEAAEAADRAVAAGGDLPLPHDVPVTIKANIDLAGTPTTHGLKALADADPGLDAPVVERIRAAGTIPIGPTNLPSFGRAGTPTANCGARRPPRGTGRARRAPPTAARPAALATGMTPLGLGNDGLGSLRWPTQCCGGLRAATHPGPIPHATMIEPV